MGNLIFRNIFMSVVLSILLCLSLAGLGGWLIFSLGNKGLSEIQSLSSFTGLEVGSALARMAGERISKEKDVELSATMKDIVSRSRDKRAQNSVNFSVDEIFLLNKKGVPLAHSDVAKMAKNSKTNYKTKEYRSILNKENNSYQSVYEKKVLESRNFADGNLYTSIRDASPELATYLEQVFPEKITTKYRLSVAVFRVDEKLPSAGIHMIVSTQSVNQYLLSLKQYSLDTLIWVVVSVFVTTTSIFFLSLLMYSGTFLGFKKANKKIMTLKDQVVRLESLEDNLILEDDIGGSKIAPQPQTTVNSEGPTVAELEIMEDERQREIVREEVSVKKESSQQVNSRQPQESFLEPVSKNEIDYEEIFDAIPLDNLSLTQVQRGRA